MESRSNAKASVDERQKYAANEARLQAQFDDGARILLLLGVEPLAQSAQDEARKKNNSDQITRAITRKNTDHRFCHVRHVVWRWQYCLPLDSRT